MDNWDGGAQGYLNSGFMLGWVTQTYRALFATASIPKVVTRTYSVTYRQTRTSIPNIPTHGLTL
jgi:hypothetical protein